MKRLRTILGQCKPEIIELVFGAALMGWGLWVLWPFMDTFNNSPAYRTLVKLAQPTHVKSEVLWGATVAASGAWQLWALLVNALRPRALAALWCMFVMVFLMVNFQISNPTSPACVWFACFAWSEHWAFRRIRKKYLHE